MSNLVYKGYFGSVELAADDDMLCGEVLGVKSLITYEGQSLAELKECFQNSVDYYLDSCATRGVVPEKPFKGTFNVRISPDLHRSLAVKSAAKGQSLNATVEEAIKNYVSV